MSPTVTTAPQRLAPWLVGLPLAAALWVLTYTHLTEIADLGLTPATHFGEAVHFFLYDTPKVLLLLTGIVFFMGVIQTFFAPERTRALLAGRRLGVGNALAFMMSVMALSAPEMLILRKVLKWPLIATFIAVVATGILLVGYVFNFVL
ncbi:MAG: hypothetical protein EOM91_10720 [Sphingobacteriia bacterium]|nr:hypothetical protein [Sphingobacteriia bacterium]NCC41351.1 hypothetical protein [Gammaproteobacteria bacterium]